MKLECLCEAVGEEIWMILDRPGAFFLQFMDIFRLVMSSNHLERPRIGAP